MKKLHYIIILLYSLLLISCDQDPEFEYVRENILEAYLIVGQPINEIRLSKTLPLNETYSFENAAIRDARITISEGENEFSLIFNDSSLKYEYNPNYLVRAETFYKIDIDMQNGDKITGSTTTPGQIEWNYSLSEKAVQFPIDSLNPELSDKIAWDYPGSLPSINLTIRCLDTTNYGQYFDDFGIGNSSSELNRRIERPWRGDFEFRDPIEYVIIPGATDSTTVVWTTFKFYGLHEVAVFAPDFNWTFWGLQYYRGQYFEPLSSVSGDGIGAFGSASVIRDTFFLIKNQP